jgi:PAS domain S-box-containing protein
VSTTRQQAELRGVRRRADADDPEKLHQRLKALESEVRELRAFKEAVRGQRVQSSLAKDEVERRYRALFTGSSEAILLVDAAGAIVEANPSAAQLLVFGTDELVGRSLNEVLADTSADRMEGSRAWRGESVACRGDGRTLPVEACAIPIEHSESVDMLWTLKNVSERRRLAKLQDEFISMAAHELKTPLTSLKGFAQLLQRGVGGQRALDIILQQVDHLNLLVDDLLDVARLESGRIAIHTSDTDLRMVIDRAIEQVLAYNPSHSIELEQVDHPIMGTWDGRRLEQVMSNLLSNAIIHAPGSKRILVRVSEESNGVRTTVRDFGPGISPAAMSNLFGRFYRVDNPTGRGVDGMGLGLYICRIIIEAHGGTIQVASKLGEGCAFTFTLPRGT